MIGQLAAEGRQRGDRVPRRAVGDDALAERDRAGRLPDPAGDDRDDGRLDGLDACRRATAPAARLDRRERAGHEDGSMCFAASSATSSSTKATWAGFSFRRASLGREERGVVDLGELALAAGAARPLHRERVRLDLERIAVAAERPRHHRLAAALLHRRQLDVGAGRREAGLFTELALGRGERRLAGFDAALRNRPGALVAVAEERPAGVDQEHLDRVGGRAAFAVHQEPRADLPSSSSVGHFTMVSSVAAETA